MEKKQLPVGRDNFEDIIRRDLYYVDKTELIEEMFANESSVYLFTRPRRFGKSLNMSMLNYFFSMDSDKTLFDGLKISKNKEICEKYQNKYPVISMTLKGVQGNNFIFAKNMFQATVGDEARKFKFLLNSPKLDVDDKDSYRKLIELNKTNKAMDAPIYEMNDSILGKSLLILSQLLYKHYGVKPIILIDEYDVPLAQSFYNNYYDKMVTLVRSFFDNGLKTNNNIEFAVLTGCLRISRESIFTGMNNLNVYTVLEDKFSNRFGFTNEEAKELLAYYGAENRLEDAKKWYDGFNIGGNAMYSPWDLLLFAQEVRDNNTARPRSYWTETSSNDIICTLLSKADEKVISDIETLISGGTVTKQIKQSITYGELYKTVENIWSVMLSTGYLTILNIDEKENCTLAIPNYEIKKVYIEKIKEWFKISLSSQTETLTKFQQAFLEGNTEYIENTFNQFLRNTVTLQSTSRQKLQMESFYHGILLGLLSSEYFTSLVVKSDFEAGKGYCDICITSQDLRTGAIIELKYSKTDKGMEKACDTALRQIERRKYTDVFNRRQTKTIYKYGIACRQKYSVVKCLCEN